MHIATPGRPPQILQIYREPLKPGTEAGYHLIEEDAARAAAALGCPHPYLGLEKVTGSKEAWWLNGYESTAGQRQVSEEYARNMPLMAALNQTSQRKAGLTFQAIEVFAAYRPELSIGTPWILGHGRFLVITVTKITRPNLGTVFEVPEGTHFVVTSAHTRQEADAAKELAGDHAEVFAVRPTWSFPAKEWSEADPLFWQPNSPVKSE